MRATRAEVYHAIDSERTYQDRIWPAAANQPQLSIGEFVLMLDEYVARARKEWTNEKRPENLTLEVVRKIAGIAVKCMEHHGAPRRTP
jgi:hypothetical protein